MNRTDRRLIGASALAAVVAVAASTAHHAPTWIWNASASVPEGLYRVTPVRVLRAGDLVAVAPPEPLAAFLAARHYLPRGALLMKPLAAVPDQTVCRLGVRIRIDGALVGEALLHDRAGRRLPVWGGCHTLRPGEVFPMNPAVRDSFDGRYFGALPAAAVVGRATPVWLTPSRTAIGRASRDAPFAHAPSPPGDPRP
jgi:conjugative transfer signal peptidase TraF